MQLEFDKLKGKHKKKREHKKQQELPTTAAVDNQSGNAIGEKSPEQATDSQPSNSEMSMIRPWIRSLNALEIAALGLFVTVIIAVIYFGQLLAMQESNRISREALESIQRAFLVFKDVTVVPTVQHSPSGTDDVWRLWATWENAGTTPATKAVNYFSYQKLSEEPNDDLFRQTKDVDKFVVTYIAPKETRGGFPIHTLPASEFGIGANANLMIAPTEQQAFAWGWVAYRDVFPNTPIHLTEFCKHILAISRHGAADYRLTYNDCEAHNCTDHDCPDYEAVVAPVAGLLKKPN